MSSVQYFRQRLEQEKGKRQQVEESLSRTKDEVSQLQRSLADHEEAREIIRMVGLKTQEQIQYHISDVTTLALESVFPDPYQLKVEFVQRRNKTECDLKFVRDNYEIDPMEASGVGAIDVASFALRIASWSMSHPRSRNVILLDEPFRCLSKNYQPYASEMLKELSRQLNLQLIITTHEEALAESADRIFEVTKTQKRTKVEYYDAVRISSNGMPKIS